MERLALNAYKGRVTAAALGDTTSAQRGTVLIDQAHRLPYELLDLVVDGYRRDGGRRRVVDSDHRGQPHEFETFGPKIVASAEGIDPDLKDRLFVIHTAPSARPVQPLPARDDEFRQLRSDLYTMMLSHWPLFTEAAGRLENGATVRNRADELWAPLEVVLTVCQAPAEEMEAARALYKRSLTETLAELGDWELALLDELDEQITTESVELTNDALLTAVLRRLDLPEDAPKPGPRWLGTALDKLNLLDGKKRRQIDGKRIRVYGFSRARVRGQVQRFGLPTQGDRPPPEGSGSDKDNANNDIQGAARLPDRSAGVQNGGSADQVLLAEAAGPVWDRLWELEPEGDGPLMRQFIAEVHSGVTLDDLVHWCERLGIGRGGGAA